MLATAALKACVLLVKLSPFAPKLEMLNMGLGMLVCQPTLSTQPRTPKNAMTAMTDFFFKRRKLSLKLRVSFVLGHWYWLYPVVGQNNCFQVAVYRRPGYSFPSRHVRVALPSIISCYHFVFVRRYPNCPVLIIDHSANFVGNLNCLQILTAR